MREQSPQGQAPTKPHAARELSSPGPAREEPLAGLVVELANAMTWTLSPADVVALKRLDPSSPGPLAFWKLAVNVLEPAGVLAGWGREREHDEQRWAAIISGLARLGGLLQPGLPLGQALARAGIPEPRLARLLNARDQVLLEAAQATASLLLSRDQPADWSDMARLVLSQGRDDEEQVRRYLAWCFYAHPLPDLGLELSPFQSRGEALAPSASLLPVRNVGRAGGSGGEERGKEGP